MLAVILVTLFAGTGGALVLARRLRRGRAAAAARAERSAPASAVAPGWLPDALAHGATTEQPVPSHVRRDVQARMEARELEADGGSLRAYLTDVRDHYGAEEAVYWAWDEPRDVLVPAIWTTPDAPRPRHFQLEEWAPLAQWAAQERLTHTAGPSPGVVAVGVSPVTDGERLFGVLSVTAEAGLLQSSDAVREWLPRHARHLSMLLTLFATRRNFARATRHGQGILQALERIREHRDREKLAEALCENCLRVTAASSAVLVRWDPRAERATVQQVVGPAPVPPGAVLQADAMIVRACASGLPFVLENATRTAATELLGPGAPMPGVGSAAILPLAREDDVLGALLLVAASPGAITRQDARSAGLLAALASTALVFAWEGEESERRSRLDSLTGLANRRGFDEHFEQMVAATDRYGTPTSLILVDIDHFKSVNDRFGHEAGDHVLRHVARVVAEGVRSSDVTARYGGEELAILLPQTSLEGAVELADRLRASVAERTAQVAGAAIPVTASFGVASFPETVSASDRLFEAADRALYAAKHDGRNCVRSASARVRAH